MAYGKKRREMPHQFLRPVPGRIAFHRAEVNQFGFCILLHGGRPFAQSSLYRGESTEQPLGTG